MSNRRRRSDTAPGQLRLPLDEPPSAGLRAGELNHKDAVREALTEALQNSPLSREEVARELSRVTGQSVSVHQLNNWTGESRRDRHVPIEYAAALSVILDTVEIARAALAGSGLDVLSSEERRYLEYGRMMAEERQRQKQKKKLLEELGI